MILIGRAGFLHQPTVGGGEALPVVPGRVSSGLTQCHPVLRLSGIDPLVSPDRLGPRVSSALGSTLLRGPKIREAITMDKAGEDT